jgi:hypothetical protein
MTALIGLIGTLVLTAIGIALVFYATAIDVQS